MERAAHSNYNIRGHIGGKLALFLAPFVVAIVLTKFYWPSPTAAPVAPTNPALATASFASGETFELLRAELENRMDVEFPKPRLGASGKGHASRGMLDISVVTKSEGGQVVNAAIESSYPGLMLEIRLTDYYGDPVSTNNIVAPNRPDRWIALRRDGDGFVDNIDWNQGQPPGDPFCRIEIGDGAGGWLPTVTPVVMQERDGRGLTICQTFPRTVADLHMRITIGDEQQTLAFANPAFAPSVPAWTADAKPWKQHLGDCEVEVIRTNRHTGARGQIPNLQFKVTGLGDYPDNAFGAHINHVADETGNAADGASRFALIPGTKCLRYSGFVHRNETYRWAASDVDRMVEGTWNGASASPPIEFHRWGRKDGVFQYQMEETTPGEWKITILLSKERAPMAPENLALMFEGEATSNGMAQRTSSSSAAHGVVAEYRWKGNLPIGQRFRVGRLSKPIETPFSFTIPVAP